jgi:uncharacterized membrane protein
MFNVTNHSKAIHTVTVHGVLYVPTQPHSIICLKDIFGLGGGVNLDIGPYYVCRKVDATNAYQHISFVDSLPYSIISRVQQINSVRQHIHTSDKLAFTHAR